MAIVFVPPVVALLFQGDHLLLLRRMLLLIGTTGFFRPITFCVTHLPDSSPDSRANQYPLIFKSWFFHRINLVVYHMKR